MRVITPPLSEGAFVDRLRATVGARYHDRHPFNVRMHEGSLTRSEVQLWVINRFHYQRCIPVKDALILSKLPQSARRRWIQRIVDHDGAGDDPGGIEKWLRLGEATGLTRARMADPDALTPGARFAVDAYVNFCRERPWLEAVASSLTELLAPALIGRRIGVLESQYPWIDPSGLEYFRARVEQGSRDAEHALELVVEGARTHEEQAAAVDALRFKCDVLWTLLDAVELASRTPLPACAEATE